MHSRNWFCCLVLVAALLAMAGCSGNGAEEGSATELTTMFTQIQTAYQTLQKTRSDLAGARAELEELEGMNERELTEEQSAKLDELPETIASLEDQEKAQYEGLQDLLSGFLTIALNEHPDNPTTLQGLEIYAAEALVTAEDHVQRAGDYNEALNVLRNAKRYFEAIDQPVYEPLSEAIKRYDEIRYLNKERFDQISKGMSQEEVMEIAGVPYFRNRRTDEERGVEYWLYERRDGGVSAIYFDKKKNVYSTKFDAVKPKVS